MSERVVFGSYGNGNDQRPSDADIAQAADVLGFEHRRGDVPSLGLLGLLEMWQEMAVNGGSFSASFGITGVLPATEWCLRNDRLELLDYTRRFLSSAALIEALPDQRSDQTMLRQARFTPLHPLRLEGDLAVHLVRGGAHRAFPGTTGQAKAVAADAAADLIGDRFDQIVIATSGDGWAPWFGWVAWDGTWIITDTGRRTLTVIALTDTD